MCDMNSSHTLGGGHVWYLQFEAWFIDGTLECIQFLNNFINIGMLITKYVFVSSFEELIKILQFSGQNIHGITA